MSAVFNSLIRARVDILLPCYNSAGTIYQALDSILRQTFKNFRVVMVDNNSIDDSVGIFESFQDGRFECIRYAETVSLGDNFNRCLEHVEADFYCIMHADDEYQEDYLEVMLAAMDSSPDAWLAYCNANIIDENSKEKFSIKNIIKKKMSTSQDQGYAGYNGLAWISDYNKIIAPTVMYRRAAIDNVGKYNPDLKFTLDWEYYFRILKSGGIILYVSKMLFNYRVHSNQQTAALVASMEKYHEMYALLNSIHSHILENYGAVKLNRFRYFIYTILADLFLDVMSMQFSSALKKFRFIVKTTW